MSQCVFECEIVAITYGKTHVYVHSFSTIIIAS